MRGNITSERQRSQRMAATSMIYDRKHVKRYVEMTVTIWAEAAAVNGGQQQTYIHNLIRYKTYSVIELHLNYKSWFGRNKILK